MSEAQHVEAYDLKVPPSPKAALPVVTFADSLSLHLNGDDLEAVHVGNAHTDGDAIVWWDKANAVHLGDLFYAGGYPFIDLGSGGSLAGVVAAIEQVLARADAKTVVIPGHGPVSSRADLAAYRDMLVAVGRRVRQLVEDGTSEEQILASHPTAEFDERYGKGAVDRGPVREDALRRFLRRPVTPQPDTSKLMPWASGSSLPQFTVQVCRRM